MDKFVHEQNLKHFRKLLSGGQHESQRDMILRLLAEEEKNGDVPRAYSNLDGSLKSRSTAGDRISDITERHDETAGNAGWRVQTA
jgi:hypothetical protein